MSERVVACIFARGGSKGLPGKNIRPFAGRPLIAHAIAAARQVPGVQRVVVSTDNAEIARVSEQEGAEVPFLRPAELARDDSPELLSWRHLVDTLDTQHGGPAMDIMVSVPTTCPLRQPSDVALAVDRLRQGGADLVITVTEPHHNPYFTMVSLDEAGAAHRVMRHAAPIWQRQMAPKVWGITGVAFATRPAYIRRASDLFDGTVAAVVVPPERAIDIDTELDFDVAEFLYRRARHRAANSA